MIIAEQMKQIAREYGVLMAKDIPVSNCLKNEVIDSTEDYIVEFMQWLSSRYCIVEKSKLKRMYLDIQTSKIHADEMNGHNRYWSMKGKQDLMDDLFGKELFSNTEQ